MEIRKILPLRGPNIWSRYPVLEAWVDVQELKDSPSNEIPGFNDRLMAWLPSMIEHKCGIGERGGFFQRLRSGTYPAHILEHVALELQSLAGTPVNFGKARETSEEGVFKVVMRYRDEKLAEACLLAGRELLLAAVHDRPYDVSGKIAKLRALADDVLLGPSTAAIVAAAKDRNIPSRRLNTGSLVQLGYGVKQRRVWTAETDGTSAIAESIAQDKELTKSLLRAAGVPVPEGRAVSSEDDAWQAACELGVPVVVKPRDGNHGRGVFVGLTTRAQMGPAFEAAQRHGSGVIVEKFAPGSEHRLLVVGNKLTAASRGEAAYVTGDGVRNINELVEVQLDSDPRRGDDNASPLAKILPLASDVMIELERQGLTADSVPDAGMRVLIQRNGNLANDVTPDVHPEVAARAVLAAQVVGLDIAGLDVVALDISRPLEEQGGVIVEVNAGPGLIMHLKPSSGTPQPVGEEIVNMLFPAGENGRIPIVCVTGTNGKTTVSRMIAHALHVAGRFVGLTCTDGIYADGRRIDAGDCSGPRSARTVLLNPRVEAAVLEAGRGGILREGLGFDRCDVAVVTNIGAADHLGQSYIDTPEDMFKVKRSPVDVVLPTGQAVLNAADPLVAEMASLSAGGVIFFALDGENSNIASHRAAGKRAVFVREGHVVLAEGAVETLLMPVSAAPLTHQGRVGFQVENLLAAVAAAWALDVPSGVIRQAAATFSGDDHDNPGRFNVLATGGVTVVIDDCHNVPALSALIAALDNFPHERRTIVYSAGDGRRDEDLVRQGELLGDAFDRVILYEDFSATSRAPGEIIGIFRQGLAKSCRAADVQDIRDYQEATLAALSQAAPGELVVLQTEDKDLTRALSLARSWAAPVKTA